MATKKTANDGAKRLVLVVNNKGGVGKSVVVRALVDALRTSGKTVSAYDADGSVGSLLTSYGTRTDGRLAQEQDPAVGVGYYDIRQDGSRNVLLDCLASGAPLIVHDLAGGSLGELKRIVDDGDGVDGLAEAIAGQGYTLTLVHVISNVQGATASVGEYVKAFGDHAEHVVVVNKAWGKDDADFPFWYGFTKPDGTKVGGRTRETVLASGGSEIAFPALQPGTFAKVEAENAPYTVAATSTDLTITERAHLAKFNRASLSAFMEAGAKLGF